MPLQNIAEDDVVDSFDTIDLNTGTRPLGHRTVRKTLTDDNSSISSYSTNATAPNLPGPGRVLGNFYDYSGRHLERALGDIARIAGFGPEAVYEKIRVLSQGDWTMDDRKASLLQKHCLKLFEHVNSREYLTRLQAIKRWGDILQHHHEIYFWFCYNESTEVMTNVDELTRNVEAFREEAKSPLHLEILNGTALLVFCHSVGLRLINFSRGTIRMVGPIFEVEWHGLRKFSTEDVEKWDTFLQYLLDRTLYVRNTSLSGISQWYIQLWSTQIDNGKLHAQNALQLCHSLRSMLAAGEKNSTVRLGTIQSLCEKTYVYLSQLLDFGSPLGLIEGIECELVGGAHNPTAIMILNDLVRSYNSVIPESSLLLLPSCLKEKIRPLLKTPKNGLLTEDSETILARIFNRLLDQALFEVKDATYLTGLSHHITSVNESTRSPALFQLVDILQSIPEVYELMNTVGGHETNDRMLKINKHLDKIQSESTSESKYGIFTDLKSILKCHTLGYEFHQLLLPIRGEFLLEGKSVQVEWKDLPHYPSAEIEKWGVSFQYLLESLLNPTICDISQWYIGFWISQLVEGTPHAHIVLQYCRSLQNVLGKVNLTHIGRRDAFRGLCKKLYMHLVRRLGSDTLLQDEGAHISSIINSLVRLHDLGPVPNLACLTTLGSTDLIPADTKEEIRESLKHLYEAGRKKKVTETLFFRCCKKLLQRAQSELEDTDCHNKLSNTTRTSRWAILQLGDILQSIPEVYMILITLGGDEIRDSVESLRQILKVSDNSMSTLERYPRILMNLRSLLACHAAGLRLASEDMLSGWNYKANIFIAQTAPFDKENIREAREAREARKARELFVPYLMDNVTFSPLIFYLKYCLSRIWLDNYSSFEQPFLPCYILQGALLTDKSVPQENRSAMEDICRTMQNSIIKHFSRTLKSFNKIIIHFAEQAMRSVYSDLTETRHVFTFEDEAEFYLSQLCNLFFEIISRADYKAPINDAIKVLSDFFGSSNVFGWFLSIRGPDAKKSISRILKEIDDAQISNSKEVGYYKGRLSRLEVHKLGVELLAPRNEKLHFEGAGLTKHLPTRTAEPTLTPEQRERWKNAFKTLVANLRSLNFIDISLFYLANCPLPYEADPMLDTTIALEYCKCLQTNIWSNWDPVHFSRAVLNIHTCLTKRVVFVQESREDLAPDEPPTFYGTPFDIPKIVKVLNDLAKLSKETLHEDAPNMSIPDY